MTWYQLRIYAYGVFLLQGAQRTALLQMLTSSS